MKFCLFIVKIPFFECKQLNYSSEKVKLNFNRTIMILYIFNFPPLVPASGGEWGVQIYNLKQHLSRENKK